LAAEEFAARRSLLCFSTIGGLLLIGLISTLRLKVLALVDRTNGDSSQFLIRHDRLDLSIYLCSTDSLFLHEDTIPGQVAKLRESFLNEGVVRDPVLVDCHSGVLLDGMHRLVALRELGCVAVPICAVDYFSPSINVGTWYRSLSGELSIRQLEAALSSSYGNFERLSVNLKRATDAPWLAAVFPSGESLRSTDGPQDVYESLRTWERCVKDLGVGVTFETESDAVEKLVKREATAIMTLPKIDKKSIIEAGLSGRLLPHKVTRHVIPARPLAVNALLEMLACKTMSLEDKNRKFVASLRARRFTRRPAGAVIENRRYDEEILAFE
jgi:hypothetical protein